MIHQLSESIADYLLYRQIITMEKYSIYSYGLEMLLSIILGIILILLCGLLTGSIGHAVLFYSIFILLRSFTGGYHADTHFTCKAILCISFLSILSSNYNVIVHVLMSFINICSVICFSPVESVNKPISAEIKKRNRKISIFLYVAFIVLSSFLFKICAELSFFITLTLCNVTLLMYIGFFKERRKQNENSGQNS